MVHDLSTPVARSCGEVRATAPFDFDQSLAFLRMFQPMLGEQTTGEQWLMKALDVAERIVVCRVTAAGVEERPALRYMLVSAEPLPEEVSVAAIDRLVFFLGLVDDLGPFYRIAEADAAFAPIVRQLYGLHQVKFSSPFENACWAVLSQRTPLSVAAGLKQRLTARFGGCLSVDGAVHCAFPSASKVAAATPEVLATVLGNGRKAEYIHAVAVAFKAVDEQWLRTAAYDDVERWLRQIKGIGPWSATFVLLRGLGRMDRLPMEQRLLDAAARVYGKPMTEAMLHDVAEPYGIWKGYWAHYLRVGA
ncbi:MAG: DNA-3-methyladenine glycosylase [Herpetosiphon sp.]